MVLVTAFRPGLVNYFDLVKVCQTLDYHALVSVFR